VVGLVGIKEGRQNTFFVFFVLAALLEKIFLHIVNNHILPNLIEIFLMYFFLICG
jgi:uncharacterized protein YqhQ